MSTVSLTFVASFVGQEKQAKLIFNVKKA